jgi:hypothetical protein
MFFAPPSVPVSQPMALFVVASKHTWEPFIQYLLSAYCAPNSLFPNSPLMVISPDGDLRRKYLHKHT